MKGKFLIKERDRGMKEIFKRVREMHGNIQVAVGIRGESAYDKVASLQEGGIYVAPDALNLVDIATIHEYGTESKGGYIPERSFIRATVEDNRTRYEDFLYRMAGQILDPKKKLDPKKALALLGELVKLDIQRRIRKGIAPKLSDRTIAARVKAGNTSTIPLIVTGQLIGAISYDVREGEKNGAKTRKKSN